MNLVGLTSQSGRFRSLACTLLFSISIASPTQHGSDCASLTCTSLRKTDAERRADGWHDFATIVPRPPTEFLNGWTEADQLFVAPPPRPAIAQDHHMQDLGGAELIVFTHYDPVAVGYIRDERLNERARLDELQQSGQLSSTIAGNRSIPPFPKGARLALTAWWPAAVDADTPMPIWDAETNPSRADGNSYLTWHRLLAVEAGSARKTAPAKLNFLGRSAKAAERVSIDAFHHVRLTANRAESLMSDPRRRKAALLAVGRPLHEGDYLLLVAVNMAFKKEEGWAWRTLWWHDRAARGKFAAGRPADLPLPWSNYLLDVAADPLTAAPDEAARISFNPWLEARFPAGGNGGGTASNCVTCHRRASYPPVPFLPITGPRPNVQTDPAFSPGRLQTDEVWSVARRP